MATHHLSTSNRSKLINELLQGQKFANQLQFLIHHKPFDEQQHPSPSSPHHHLILKILRSFTLTLSLLGSCTTAADLPSHDDHNNLLQLLLPTNSSNHSPCTDDRISEDSGDSHKKRPASKDRRGCYKRKKNLQVLTTVSSTTEDAHAWRKYGQKEILNAKYPRSYYRCTHKYDQGCKATKQVQRIEDDPQMYETTYIGDHTCRDLLVAPKIIIDSGHPWRTGSFSRFSTSNSNPTKIIEQEYIKAETSTDDISDNLSSLDSVVWEDLTPFESSDPAAAMVSDYGDTVSTVYSPCNKISSNGFDIDFESEFHFDETQFFELAS